MTTTAEKEGTGRPAGASLEDHKKWLVETGDAIGRAGAKNEGWKSQGRILLEAARHETEPLVLLNLLRYQVIRNEKAWKKPEDLSERVEKAIQECTNRGGDDSGLTMELIQHLLLYTLRAYTAFENKKQGGSGGDDGE